MSDGETCAAGYYVAATDEVVVDLASTYDACQILIHELTHARLVRDFSDPDSKHAGVAWGRPLAIATAQSCQ